MASSIKAYCLTACNIMLQAVTSATPDQGKQQLAELVQMHCQEVESLKSRVTHIKAEMQRMRAKSTSHVEENTAALAQDIHESMTSLSRLQKIERENEEIENDGKTLDGIRELLAKVEQIVGYCGLAPHSTKFKAVFGLINETLSSIAQNTRQDEVPLLKVVSGMNVDLDVYLEGLKQL